MNLKRIVEDSDTRAGKVFAIFIQALILVSLVDFSIETLPDLTPSVDPTDALDSDSSSHNSGDGDGLVCQVSTKLRIAF